MSEEEGDDGLCEEVGNRAVEHPANGTHTIVQLQSASHDDTVLTMPAKSRLPVRTKSPFNAEVWA